MKRRTFIKGVGAGSLLLPGVLSIPGCNINTGEKDLKISLNQWSYFGLHVGDTSADGWWSDYPKRLKNDPKSVLNGLLTPEDFPRIAREIYNVNAIEIEASLYYSHLEKSSYFKEFKKRCDDLGVDIVMVSNVWEGNLASLEKNPAEIAKNYHQWVDITAELGCPSIMVDMNGRSGDKTDARNAGIEGMSALTEYAVKAGVNILTENHNWYSADPDWLVDVIKGVNHPNCGLTADFGGFCGKGWRNGECMEPFDTYEGISKLLPYAKSVSAKSASFDESGEEIHVDYKELLRRITESGYNGYIGIEYVGEQANLESGIKKTIQLIKKYS